MKEFSDIDIIRGDRMAVMVGNAFSNYHKLMSELDHNVRLDSIRNRLRASKAEAMRDPAKRRHWFHQWNRFADLHNKLRKVKAPVESAYFLENRERVFQ